MAGLRDAGEAEFLRGYESEKVPCPSAAVDVVALPIVDADLRILVPLLDTGKERAFARSRRLHAPDCAPSERSLLLAARASISSAWKT